MILLNNLKREYEEIREEIHSAIQRVFDNSWFILGEETKNFEEEFSKYVGTKFAVGVNSGSDALYLAVKALEISKGDEVISVSNTMISTADAITRNGAKPVFVDIKPETYLINESKIEAKITNKTKAIIPVHIYGQVAEMSKIMELADKYKLHVIEDACQAHGAEYKNIKAGGIGHIGCFSFYPTKNLGAYGDGGIIVTNNKKLANKIKKTRNYGQSEKYYHDFIGVNSRLDEIQAAILRTKLRYLDEWNNKRRKLAKLYNKLLADTNIITPIETEYAKHVYHLYIIRSNNRNALQKHLLSKGIQTLIHYPIPVHLQKLYKTNEKLRITEKICSEILSLPMSPYLQEKEIEYISKEIHKFIENN